MFKLISVLFLVASLSFGQAFSISGNGASAAGVISGTAIAGGFAVDGGQPLPFASKVPCLADVEWGQWYCFTLWDGPVAYQVYLGWFPGGEMTGWWQKISGPLMVLS